MTTLKKTDIFDYQQRFIRLGAKVPHCAMFLRVGAGKTIIALTLAEYYLRTGKVGSILILGPKRVVNNVWEEEASKWEHLSDLTFCNLSKGPHKRVGDNMDENYRTTEARIHLINVDNFTRLLQKFSHRWRYDMIIWDEYSAAKHQSSKRAKAMLEIMKSKTCKRFLGLTGTPASNGLQDVWNLTRILDGGRRLGRYKSHFEQKYMYIPAHLRHDPYAKPQMLPGASKAIYERIKDICFSMPDDEYPRQDKPTHNKIWVSLPEEARGIYDAAEKKFLVALKNGEYVDIANAAVAATKLMQISSGAVYTQSPEWEAVHDAKLEALEELVEESSGRPLLVFHNFRFSRVRIRDRFPDAVFLSDDVLPAWNRGEIPMMVANPQGAGHGLNLQEGGSDTVWFDLTWNLEHFSQANGRLDRTGQKNQVIQHYIMGLGTIDEEVMERLQGKASVEQALMKALQRRAI